MLKGYLKSIKDDLWSVLSEKKYVQREIKESARELKAYLKGEMARNAEIWHDSPDVLAYHNRQDKERVDRLLFKAVTEISGMYHNDQSYHLIYKDGSEACVTAEEILLGEPFPKVSDVVYAELSSADDNYDTETGETLTSTAMRLWRLATVITPLRMNVVGSTTRPLKLSTARNGESAGCKITRTSCRLLFEEPKRP